MKKKLISIALTAALSISAIASVSAQEVPMVRANEREIVMDVEGEYVDGVFVAPIRRICSIAEARCDWYEEDRKIIVNTKDNVTRLFLYPERDTFRIFKFTSIADGVAEDLKLDVPLRIVEGRTLVPFEQICKALNLEYEWSEDKSVVTVKTGMVITDEKKLEAYIVADKEDVAAGEEVTLSIMVNNVDLYPDYGYSGYTAAVIYNPEEFEYVGSSMTRPDGSHIDALGADNAAFSDDSLKAVYVVAESLPFSGNLMTAGKVVLKALTDNGGTLRLSDRISTIGYDTSFVISHKENLMDVKSIEKATVLNISPDEIVIK